MKVHLLWPLYLMELLLYLMDFLSPPYSLSSTPCRDVLHLQPSFSVLDSLQQDASTPESLHLRVIAAGCVQSSRHIPATGLAGQDDEGSNAEVQFPDAEGTFTMLAKRHIAKGEEVRSFARSVTNLLCRRIHHSWLRWQPAVCGNSP